jgi:hypothetical protein
MNLAPSVSTKSTNRMIFNFLGVLDIDVSCQSTVAIRRAERHVKARGAHLGAEKLPRSFILKSHGGSPTYLGPGQLRPDSHRAFSHAIFLLHGAFKTATIFHETNPQLQAKESTQEVKRRSCRASTYIPHQKSGRLHVNA